MNNSEEITLKKNTARLSIYSNSFLIIIKLLSGIWSGSVSIISEAIHSALDLIASFIAFIAVKISDKPADAEHPYGHGKFENVSGVLESGLIFIAAIWIIWEAVNKFVEGESIIHQKNLLLGIVVMLISGVLNFFVSRKLYRVSKLTESVALEADALHLKTDVYTSLGVSIGLGLIYLTGWFWLDSFIAIFVALLIIFEAFNMLKKSFDPLLDSNLPKEELSEIQRIIRQNTPNNYACKDLKTRRSGQNVLIAFTLICPADSQVSEVSELMQKIKSQILNYNKRCQIFISVESD